MAEPLLGVVKMESWAGVADTEGETTIDWFASLARKTVARASLMPGIGKCWQNSAFLLTGLAKLDISGPLQSLGARGVVETGRIPGHARLANTDRYLDSTRHAERCVRMSVTQGDASKPPTVVPAYSVTRTVGTCSMIVQYRRKKNSECPRTSQVRWHGLRL